MVVRQNDGPMKVFLTSDIITAAIMRLRKKFRDHPVCKSLDLLRFPIGNPTSLKGFI